MFEAVSAQTAFRCIGRLTRTNYVKLFKCINKTHTNIADILISIILLNKETQDIIFNIMQTDLLKITPDDISSDILYFDNEQVQDYIRKSCIHVIQVYYGNIENRKKTFNDSQFYRSLIENNYIYLHTHNIYFNIHNYTIINK